MWSRLSKVLLRSEGLRTFPEFSWECCEWLKIVKIDSKNPSSLPSSIAFSKIFEKDERRLNGRKILILNLFQSTLILASKLPSQIIATNPFFVFSSKLTRSFEFSSSILHFTFLSSILTIKPISLWFFLNSFGLTFLFNSFC